jgi:hypothetical protein
MAFEAEELGMWTHTKDTVPVTENGESSSVRNLTENVSHTPSLRTRSVVDSMSTKGGKTVSYSEVPLVYGYPQYSSGYPPGQTVYSPESTVQYKAA